MTTVGQRAVQGIAKTVGISSVRSSLKYFVSSIGGYVVRAEKKLAAVNA
jgi:hypothetical protein